MNNYEKIKNMSIEEMAHQVAGIFGDGLATTEYDEDDCFGKIYLNLKECQNDSCPKCYKQWLESEAE